MAQVTSTPVSPLNALGRRWKLATVMIVVGAGAGVGVGLLTPTTYTGSARVAVGSQSLDARVVAGYTTASQQLASDVARYVNDRQEQDDLEPVLGTVSDTIEKVSASPLAGSSVIVVEVDGTNAAAATTAAQTIAEQLVTQVNAGQTTPDTLLQSYTDLSNQVEAARQAAVDTDSARSAAESGRADAAVVDAARAAAQKAAADLDVLEVRQEALSAQYRNALTNTPSASALSVVRTAEISRTNRSSTLQRDGLAGAGLGGLAALLLATRLERRRPRDAEDATTSSIDLDADRSVPARPAVAPTAQDTPSATRA